MPKRKFQGQPIPLTVPVPTTPTAEIEFANSKDDYPYEPLADPRNHIRVLVIKPGERASPLIGHFMTRQLTLHDKRATKDRTNPAYATLSYAWGDGQKKGSMRIANQTPAPKRTLLYQVRIT